MYLLFGKSQNFHIKKLVNDNDDNYTTVSPKPVWTPANFPLYISQSRRCLCTSLSQARQWRWSFCRLVSFLSGFSAMEFLWTLFYVVAAVLRTIAATTISELGKVSFFPSFTFDLVYVSLSEYCSFVSFMLMYVPRCVLCVILIWWNLFYVITLQIGLSIRWWVGIIICEHTHPPTLLFMLFCQEQCIRWLIDCSWTNTKRVYISFYLPRVFVLLSGEGNNQSKK